MSNGTAAVIITDAVDDRIALSAALAMTEHRGAHLDVHCVAIDQSRSEVAATGSGVFLVPLGDAVAYQRAEELKQEVAQLVPRDRSAVQLHPIAITDAALEPNIARLARYADYLIIGRPYGDHKRPYQAAVLAGALFQGRMPVIVVPDDAGSLAAVPRRIAVAWDDSDAAMAAVRAALPLLRLAELVDVVLVDPPPQAADRSDPGGALALFLARNAVHAQISVLAPSLPRVSEVLCRFARDSDIDLMVMGGYGHSRLREAMLGGVTRDMLAMAPVPLLLAH